ncbi:NTF2-related export protein 1 [Orchesella cincta]|uniref:NTF2-related export protein 1 n=1 Tax=Orchesella cincta TaxID=48709 RepID=A0A1D2M3V5_ORCCI|nr:NTF2-related export protein 1 [Orchesella cincta]
MDCNEGNAEMTTLTPMQLPADSSLDENANNQVLPQCSTTSQDEALKVAETFCKTYYETVQKKPHVSSKTGFLIIGVAALPGHTRDDLDGNPILNQQQIQSFFEQLPSLTFSLMALDCHPASALAVGSKKTFFIKAAGLYRISGPGSQKQFTQDIVLVAEGDKYKIAVDTFRTKHPE